MLMNRVEENIQFMYLSMMETSGLGPKMPLPTKPSTEVGDWMSGVCEAAFSNSLYVHFLVWLKQKALMMIKLSAITGKNWRVLCGRRRFLAILPYWRWPTWYLGITHSGRLHLEELISSHPLRVKCTRFLDSWSVSLVLKKQQQNTNQTKTNNRERTLIVWYTLSLHSYTFR